MDPKQQLNQLDPKLKEAYERVMGAPVGTSPQSTPQPTTPPPPVTTPPASSQPLPPPPPPPPAPPAQAVAQPPIMPQAAQPMQFAQPIPVPTGNPFGQPPAQPQQQGQQPQQKQAKPGEASHGFVAGKKGLGISPIFLIVIGIIFLAVYTVFWLKFFNIPLPFSIPFLSQ